MAWRVRLNTKRYYLDFEWGKPEQAETVEQVPSPSMNDQPLVTAAVPIGFRFAGGQGVFATEIECREKP